MPFRFRNHSNLPSYMCMAGRKKQCEFWHIEEYFLIQSTPWKWSVFWESFYSAKTLQLNECFKCFKCFWQCPLMCSKVVSLELLNGDKVWKLKSWGKNTYTAQKHGDGARKRPCVFDDVSTVLFAGFAKKPMRFAIHSCGNVNVMTWIPCKGYRPKSIISTFAAFLLHFSKIASAKLRCVTLPHRSPKLLYKLCLQSRRHIHA